MRLKLLRGKDVLGSHCHKGDEYSPHPANCKINYFQLNRSNFVECCFHRRMLRSRPEGFSLCSCDAGLPSQNVRD